MKIDQQWKCWTLCAIKIEGTYRGEKGLQLRPQLVQKLESESKTKIYLYTVVHCSWYNVFIVHSCLLCRSFAITELQVGGRISVDTAAAVSCCLHVKSFFLPNDINYHQQHPQCPFKKFLIHPREIRITLWSQWQKKQSRERIKVL